MHIAVLHVTRMKVKTDDYTPMVKQADQVANEYVKNHLSIKADTFIQNHFINTGHSWTEMREVFDEINAEKYDGFVLWIAPEIMGMKYFYKDFMAFTHEHFKKCPAMNLHYQDGYVSFLKAGIKPSVFGSTVASITKQTA